MPASESFAGLFGFKNGKGIEGFEAPEHFMIEDMGGLLVVKMGEVCGCDDDRVFLFESTRQRHAKFFGNGFFRGVDHDREQFEFMLENAL